MHEIHRTGIVRSDHTPQCSSNLGRFVVAASTIVLLSPLSGFAQEPDAVVSKDAISVHRVERGTMTLREIATGAISSLVPARATVLLTSPQSTLIRVGQSCSVQVAAPMVLRGRVSAVRTDTSLGGTVADLTLAESFAPGAAINQRIGALIDVGQAEDIVYFERPASAQPATTSTIFVLEPDGVHAKRVTVAYGRLSGSQLEILRGLSPGDRVIVTDFPGLAGHDRVVLK